MKILQDSIGLVVFGLLITFGILSCQHEPGHVTPEQEPTQTASGCANNQAAQWVNEPTQRIEKVVVSWIRSADPSDKTVEIRGLHSLHGGGKGTLNDLSNVDLGMYGGNMQIKFCCGEDMAVRGQTHSQGTMSDFEFDGTSSTESEPFFKVNLINGLTWTIQHCRDFDDSYVEKSIDIPISVLTKCSNSDGRIYEKETIFTFRTIATCNSLAN